MSFTRRHKASCDYMDSTFGPFKKCKNPKCRGCMVEVLVSYKDHGQVYHEYECVECGRVIKDPTFRPWKERSNRRR